MPSPVGHALAGLSVAAAANGAAAPNGGPAGGRRALLGLGAFSAAAPDLDFLPGLLAGAPNAFHPSITHTLGGLVAFMLVVAAVCLIRRAAVAVPTAVAALSYGSHVVLDFFAYRGGPGILWPLDVRIVNPGWFPFMGIGHGGEADGIAGLADALFTWHNVLAVGLELALFLPVLGLVLWWSRRGRGPAAG